MYYRRQPLKTLYLLSQLVTIPVFHFPSWLLSAIPMLRSNKKGFWNIMGHLRTSSLRHLIDVMHQSGNDPIGPNHLAIEDSTGGKGVWIPPVPSELIVGEIKARADSHQVNSISIPGYWIHKDEGLVFGAPPSKGEPVVMYLHGGAYTVMSAHPDNPISQIPKSYLEHTPFLQRTFSIEYRLSTGPPLQPTNPFPTALIDALAGYIYLVNMGFAEEDIIVSGDSAGANMALALTKYLIDHQAHRPQLPRPPGSLILLSPWADVSECFVKNPDSQSSLVKNLNYDWLAMNGASMLYAATAFVGGKQSDIEEAHSNPYISPASTQVLGLTTSSPRTISFKGFPRTWIDVGSLETLLDQVERLRDAMIEDMGDGMVHYNKVDGGTHVYLAFSRDGTESFKKIASWLSGAR